MAKETVTRLLCWVGIAVLAAAMIYFGLRWVNPTSSAIYVSDSPDGKYRFAEFRYDDGILGEPKYEAGLFAGSWPHRELPGERYKWLYDSGISPGELHVTWHKDGLDVKYYDKTFSGQVVGGKQQWNDN